MGGGTVCHVRQESAPRCETGGSEDAQDFKHRVLVHAEESGDGNVAGSIGPMMAGVHAALAVQEPEEKPLMRIRATTAWRI